MRPSALVPALVLVVLLGGCGEPDQEEVREDYCAAVVAQQQALSEAIGDGEPTSLIAALPILRDLRAEAPRDLVDEWETVVTRIERLDGALREAGVDPATYDGQDPPEGLTPDQVEAIDGAARALAGRETVAAFTGVEQHALDICKQPLTL